MMHKFLMIILAGAIWFPIQAQTAATVMTKVKQKYETLNQVCAEFSQTFHWKMADETQVTKGSLCTRNGVMFRIDLQDQIIVTDGVTLWTLSKSNKQVLIDNAANGKDDNPFLKSFIEKYFKNYKAELLAEESVQAAPHFHLLLTAQSEDEFERSVELWVNKSTFIMSRVKQFDVNGNYSTYEVTALKTDAPESDQDFKMSVPEGYEAVDLR